MKEDRTIGKGDGEGVGAKDVRRMKRGEGVRRQLPSSQDYSGHTKDSGFGRDI